MIQWKHSPFNQRQIELMQIEIDQYNQKKISLNDLIVDLSVLFSILENVDKNWKQQFESAWGTLELIYSFAVYDQKKQFDEDDKLSIDSAIKKIEKLIREGQKTKIT